VKPERTDLSRLTRPRLFLSIVLFSFVNPYTLFLLNPRETLFILTNAIVLSLWLWVGWERIKRSEHRPRIPEILLGLGILTVSIASIIREGSSFGLLDMLLTFLGLSLVFYGVRGLKMLSFPILFFVAMIIVSQAESASFIVRDLEYFLMSGWADSLLGSLGVDVDILRDSVRMTIDDVTYLFRLNDPLRGLRGIVAYGSLSLAAILALKATQKKKVMLASIALIGTFFFTLLRLALTLLGISTIGIETGLAISDYFGLLIMTGWFLAFKFLALRPPARPNNSAAANTSIV